MLLLHKLDAHSVRILLQLPSECSEGDVRRFGGHGDVSPHAALLQCVDRGIHVGSETSASLLSTLDRVRGALLCAPDAFAVSVCGCDNKTVVSAAAAASKMHSSLECLLGAQPSTHTLVPHAVFCLCPARRSVAVFVVQALSLRPSDLHIHSCVGLLCIAHRVMPDPEQWSANLGEASYAVRAAYVCDEVARATCINERLCGGFLRVSCFPCNGPCNGCCYYPSVSVPVSLVPESCTRTSDVDGDAGQILKDLLIIRGHGPSSVDLITSPASLQLEPLWSEKQLSSILCVQGVPDCSCSAALVCQ